MTTDRTRDEDGVGKAWQQASSDAPMCYMCGVFMVRSGACHVCQQCGSTSGCS